MFELLARDNGRVHVCGDGGHPMVAPENTLIGLTAAREHGGTAAVVDALLTADGEIVLMRDDFLDRTTDGTGLVSRTALDTVRALDAGAWFNQRFEGEPVPTLAEALAHARAIGLGLVVEIRETRETDRLVARLAGILAGTDLADHAVFAGADHVALRALKTRLPAVRTEGLLAARHADPVGVARAARLDAVSVGHLMFRPEDGAALHAAGIAVRLRLQRPEDYARHARAGIDLLAGVRDWVGGGAVDSVSGDDVGWLAALVARSRTRERLPA